MQSTPNTIRWRWLSRLIALLSVTAAVPATPAHASTILYGVVYNESGSTEELATIDPTTAAATAIGTAILNCCTMSGTATLGAGSGVMYFVGTYFSETSPQLFGFNTQTGSLVSSPTTSSSIILDSIAYDSVMNTLLGFVYSPSTQTEQLATINPSTAAATPLGSGVSQCCSVSTAPALDPTQGILYLTGTEFAESSPRLFGFNIQTGAVVSNPMISSSIYLDALEASAYGAAPCSSLTPAPAGAATCSTPGVQSSTQVGYATLAVNSGTTPYGTAVFSYKENGVRVSEAGVPASPPTTLAQIFIDYRTGVNPVPG